MIIIARHSDIILILFQYHFGADQFEKERIDGTKKLKLHAVPTIFGELVIQITNKRKKQKTGTVKLYTSQFYNKIIENISHVL